jgi:hypothetical protein
MCDFASNVSLKHIKTNLNLLATFSCLIELIANSCRTKNYMQYFDMRHFVVDPVKRERLIRSKGY